MRQDETALKVNDSGSAFIKMFICSFLYRLELVMDGLLMPPVKS